MTGPDYNAAQAATIERNDIVVQVAKMIDPGAFSVWFDGTGPDAKPRPSDARIRYMQARAVCIAAEILKLAAGVPDLAKQLADSEAADWELLGVPIADSPDLRKVIDRKYQSAETSQ